MLESTAPLFTLLVLSIATQITIPIPLDMILLGMTAIKFNYALLVTIVVTGLTVGAIIDYSIGRFGIEAIPWLHKRKNTRGYKKAEKFYKKYGKWTLLFSSFPFVGKYFPLLAGIMETKFFNLFVSLFSRKSNLLQPNNTDSIWHIKNLV